LDGDDLLSADIRFYPRNIAAFPNSTNFRNFKENYSNKSLLKDVEKSNKVALNLKTEGKRQKE